jgi:hypothetical protein
MLEIATAVGFPRRDWQTPEEHRHVVRETLPGPPARRIVNRFQRYFYGNRRDEADPQAMSSLLEDLDELGPRQ